MMKKILISGLAVLALAGCGSAVDQSDPSNGVRLDVDTTVQKVTVDGVECIVYDGYKSGGVSCNWEAYNANR